MSGIVVYRGYCGGGARQKKSLFSRVCILMRRQGHHRYFTLFQQIQVLWIMNNGTDMMEMGGKKME